MCHYFKNRLRREEHPELVKVVFLSICRQHLLVNPEADSISEDAVGVVDVDGRSTSEILLESTMAEFKNAGPIRKITLDEG